MRDSQRRSVSEWPGPELNLDECQELIRKIWYKLFGIIEPPIIKDGRGRRRGCGTWLYISLPKFARKKLYVFHELAHSIIENFTLKPVAPHGPEFLGMYLELMKRFSDVDVIRARARAVCGQSGRRLEVCDDIEGYLQREF